MLLQTDISLYRGLSTQATTATFALAYVSPQERLSKSMYTHTICPMMQSQNCLEAGWCLPALRHGLEAACPLCAPTNRHPYVPTRAARKPR